MAAPKSLVPQPSLTVVGIESRRAVTAACVARPDGVFEIARTTDWDPAPHLTDLNGQRLLEEVERQVRVSWKDEGPSSAVAVTLPGTLTGNKIIASSSRLGIRSPVDFATALEAGLAVKSRVFHDVTCMALGEWAASPPQSPIATDPSTLAYVFADEGIGSRLLIDGVPYVGAGAAGVLGRLIVQPDGAYYRALAARGPLEVFASRPWVSENLVALFNSEAEKQGVPPPPGGRTKFRRALEVASNADWTMLDYAHIADGIATSDPIALDVTDTAARYLGFAINALITVIHPHKLVLGGSMFTQLPGFADETIAYARRFCWPLAWNRLTVAVSTSDRKAQIVGACELMSQAP